MKEKIKFIREKCIEANPEIEADNGCAGCRYIPNPICLADVLWVVDLLKEGDVYFIPDREKIIADIFHLWNTKDNNLENQSEKTIDFIYNLLK